MYVFILTTEDDSSARDIRTWINHLGYECVIVNAEDKLVELSIEIGETVQILMKFETTSGIVEVDTSQIKSFFYRKGDFLFDYKTLIANTPSELKKHIFHYLMNEGDSLNSFIINYLLREFKSLGTYSEKTTDKLSYLLLAKECGLNIPPLTISNSKKYFDTNIDSQFEYITKSVSDTFNEVINTTHYYSYTEKVSKSVLNEMDDVFFPSLIQRYVEKKIELRIFFMHKDIYAAALFSQFDDSYKVDFRSPNSSGEHTFKITPYELSADLKKKLLKFINRSELTTGSIDMVVDHSDEVYFLEVNPCGHFNFISDPCNFNIEQKIAEYLAYDK